MPTILYLLFGASGHYDAYTQWVVAVLTSMEDAIALRDKAQAASRAAIDAHRREHPGLSCVYFQEPTPFDLGHQVRDDEVRYRIEAVPFVGDVSALASLFGVVAEVGAANERALEVNNPGYYARFVKARRDPLLDAPVRSDFAAKLSAVLHAASKD